MGFVWFVRLLCVVSVSVYVYVEGPTESNELADWLAS